MAISMFFILLLHLLGLSGAEHETLCVSNACFTLHMEKLSFYQAQNSCTENGGYLMTVRDGHEEEMLRSLLPLVQKHHDRGQKVWIGLKLHKHDCVQPDETLRGFKWISGEENSHYSNWKKEPGRTCTQERCVKVDYASSSGQNQLRWTDGGCNSKALYACKFRFKGMCSPLDLLEPGHITYTPPFSKEPLKSDMKSLPVATYANILCPDGQSHYTVCMGAHGAFTWTDHGPFCEPGERSCKVNNGGCEHWCRQQKDDVRCHCKAGYELGEDGSSCRMENLCGPDTCEHLCVMGESGFSCQCPEGFQLGENLRDCRDVDECELQACEDHLCVNVHGSYTCECKVGYEMLDGECTDVDECDHSRCGGGCLNTVGSFDCYCGRGFALSTDGFSCVDVNAAGGFTGADRPETNGTTPAPRPSVTPAASSDESFTESLTRPVELQHQSPHTDTPPPHPANATHGDRHGNASLATVTAQTVTGSYKVMICVLGSVVPLLLLVAVTLFIAIFRCSRSKKEVKKNSTADGYCWVSSGLDPRLEKLYESILTDDL
ncbi:complement component C1q receptor [Odontesthes bonariensis]|uniref:complement component C1q receptor n=1 Tax=Odontesthes bonariensis TaxID=219752 RepID=UPI003F583418